VTGRLLTARQVADLLGVTAETVLRYTRAGELPAIRLPGTARGRLRYRPDDVDAFLEQHSTRGAAGRGVTATRSDRADRGGYVPVPFPVTATPPRRDGATIEED
jgi:excisionase family DNA binding protein